MYDGIQLFVKSKRFYNQLIKKYDLDIIANKETGELKEYLGQCGHIFIHAWPNGKHGPGVLLNGSLHKYYHGTNHGVFTFKEITKAIDRFYLEYGLNEQDLNVIQKIEIGVNYHVQYPKGILDAAMLYNGRTAQRDPDKRMPSKYWRYNQYIVKLYQKSDKILRLEVRITDMRKIKHAALKRFSDLKNVTCCISCLAFLYSLIDKFLFVPIDKEKVLQNVYSDEWNQFRSESYWESLSHYRKCRYQAKVKKIISEYSLIDWASYLKKEFIKISEEIIGIPIQEALATNSKLGLLDETVARPKGMCNRQTARVHQSDGTSIYNVRVNNSKGTTVVIVYRLPERLRAIVIVFGHLCRSPPRRQSIKRMFYRNYAANEKISFKPSFDVYLLVQKS